MTAFFVAPHAGACRSTCPTSRYVFILKWLTLSLLAYAAVLFVVHVPWRQVALHTVWPRFTPNAAAAAVVVGVFGTTISPYLFFWQASQEVEDMEASAPPPWSAIRPRRRRERTPHPLGYLVAGCFIPTSRRISSSSRRR